MSPSSIRSPIVTVPARNEEECLPHLLSALAAQHWIVERGAPLPVVLVLNNTTDRSREVVSAVIGAFPALAIQLLDVTFDAEHAHVGSARRMAMETALAGCGDPLRTAILTTDADAKPDVDWVSANLRHLAQGIDLVGGFIIGNPAEEAKLGPEFRARARQHEEHSRAVDRLASLIHPLPHDPWPRHHDHTGASLAVRAEVYRAVGGLPALPFREDIGLVERVHDAGYRIRHPLDVRVEVSARLVGRAPGGMADCLAGWKRAAAAGEPLLVEHPASLPARLSRTYFGFDGAGRGLSSNELAPSLQATPTHAMPLETTSAGTIPVEEAMTILGTMIEQAGGAMHAR